jgi:hypothetical protein
MLAPADVKQVQAGVFQVVRSPGKTLTLTFTSAWYPLTGALLAMPFTREHWVWV